MRLIPLPSLSVEINRRYGCASPGLRKLWELLVDGTLPGEQIRGRWFVRESNLDEIMGTLHRLAQERRRCGRRVEAVLEPAACA